MILTEQTIVYQSKKKLVGQIIFCIAFVAVGIWILTNKNRIDKTFVETYRLNLFIGGLTVLVFASFLSLWIFKLLDKKPGVLVDENGIVDNSTYISVGKIPWSDIESVKPSNYSSNVITVILKEPAKYIDKQKNPIKKKLLKANYKKNGSPVNIQTLSLNTDNKNLINAINEHLNEFNKKI